MTIVCGDSHSSTHESLGALAQEIGTSGVEHILTTQCLIQKKMKNMLVQVDGDLTPGVTAKDLILYVIGKIGTVDAIGCTIEFGGWAIKSLSIAGPMTVCKMVIILQSTKSKTSRESLKPALKYMGLKESRLVTNILLDRISIGSCTNSRIEDLRAAAAIVKGKKVAVSIKLPELCLTMDFGYFWLRVLLISLITTVLKMEFYRLSRRRMLLVRCLLRVHSVNIFS